MARISINIPDNMKEWLDQYPNLNRSKLFREAVYRKRQLQKNKISSFVIFITISIWVLATVLILIATQPLMAEEYRVTLILLGVIMAILAGLLFYKEKREIKIRNAS